MSLWVIFVVAALFAFLLTGCLRRYAVAHHLMDMPNPRSSHDRPTPRGGGVAVMAAFLATLALLVIEAEITGRLFLALAGAGGTVAAIGFLDDHRDVPARWRLLVHFAAAGWALAWLGGVPPLQLPGGATASGWLIHGLALVYLVWLLNLYNFMDGIDGLAGIEAVTVCAGAALLSFLSPQSGTAWVLPILLLSAVVGFLLWNFPKAKIFMGDAGSGFVGIVLGVLSLHAAWVAPELLWGWLILLGGFAVDATLTLLQRVRRGERFYEAHRNHAYQYAARRYRMHWPVSMAFGVINLFWLLPVAAAVVLGRLDGFLGLIVAYVPLIGLATWFKAGARELQEV